jgi:hypothetical protein
VAINLSLSLPRLQGREEKFDVSHTLEWAHFERQQTVYRADVTLGKGYFLDKELERSLHLGGAASRPGTC